MNQIFVSLLMSFLINDQVKAQIPISFTDIETIYEWGMKTFATIDKYRNPDRTRENIEVILHQVEELSSKLDALEIRMDVKLDVILNCLLTDFETRINLIMPKAKLSDYIDAIHHIYDSSKKYTLRGSYCKETLEKFSDSILWGKDSLPNTLIYIRDLFIPSIHRDINSGFLSLTIQHDSNNLPTDCDKFASSQQRMYYIYTKLIMAEMKGLATIKQIYTTKWLINDSPYDYAAELDDARISYEQRLKEYYELFKQDISFLPRHLRRCHVYSPKLGDDYLELQNFSRIMLFDKNYDVHHACEFCLKNSQLHDISRITNTKIYNCTRLSTSGTFCLADPSSPREYIWWKDREGVLYGHNKLCTNTKMVTGSNILRPGSTVYTVGSAACNLCMCSVDQNKTSNDNNSTIWRISVTEQISDLWNNMVVTGVKFVIHDNALHLQIQETKFSYSGMIYNDSKWKELDLQYYNAGINEVKAPMQYVPLRYDRKTIYLDEIKVAEGCAVAGVKFQLVDDSAFRLQVLATEFDLGTDKVFPFGSSWIDASTHPMRPDDYKRDRIEIHMDKSDDPTRGSNFNYDLESNKMIKFTHTDLNKDAGQTTIPLLDARPAETRPAFPLDGVGLSFRGQQGYGGFIAIRIYTIGVASYMKFSETSPDNKQTNDAISLTTNEEALRVILMNKENSTKHSSNYYYYSVVNVIRPEHQMQYSN